MLGGKRKRGGEETIKTSDAFRFSLLSMGLRKRREENEGKKREGKSGRKKIL